jgi:hypothetical protein
VHDAGLWAFIDELPRAQRPYFIQPTGISEQSAKLRDAKTHTILYLVKLPQTCNVKQMIPQVFIQVFNHTDL